MNKILENLILFHAIGRRVVTFGSYMVDPEGSTQARKKFAHELRSLITHENTWDSTPENHIAQEIRHTSGILYDGSPEVLRVGTDPPAGTVVASSFRT